MLAWPQRLFRRRPPEPVPHDPDEERAVAARLLPLTRSALVAPGADDPAALLDLVERLAPPKLTEVLTPPDMGADSLVRLIAQGFVLYDAAAVPRQGLVILDRRLGWRMPDWEPLPNAFRTAYRLLWTRLGYYTVQTGTVDRVHAENRLFSFVGRTVWVNVAYRGLPLPAPGERVQVLGMFSFLGSNLPVLHALSIVPADPAPNGAR